MSKNDITELCKAYANIEAQKALNNLKIYLAEEYKEDAKIMKYIFDKIDSMIEGYETTTGKDNFRNLH